MNNQLVSVIVPVYNGEQHLEKCLKSILNQSYKNIEIIIVNDGSTDNSDKLCEKYEKKYNNIKVFNIKNSGPSRARNVGIKESNGEYIIFIDSDDYINEKMIEKLYNNSIKYNADLSMCNLIRVDEKGNRIKDYNRYMDGIKIYYGPVEFRKNLEDPRGYYTFAVNKLIRRKTLKDIRFREDIFYNEDGIFYYDLSKNLKISVYDSDNKLYYYVSHNKSSTNKGFNKKFLTVLKTFKIIENYYDDFDEENKCIFAYKYINFIIRAKIFLYNNQKNYNKKKELDNIIKKYYPKAIKCSLLTKSGKTKFVLKIKFPKTYYLIKKILKNRI